jgi:hypothetical protein
MSTMSATIFGNIDDRRSFMLDPWHRLRLGWMEPEIQAFNATGASNTQLAPDMTGVRPLLIYDPRRYDLDTRTGDYFLVEYRTNGRSGYDQDVSSASVDRTGMAIWQIREGSLIVETFAPDGIGGSQLWDSGDGTITPLYADGTSSPFRLRVGPTSLTSFGATVEWTDDGLLRPRIDGGTTVIRPGQIAILDGMFAVDATGAGARFFNRATGVWTTATLATPWTSSRVLVNVPATLGEGDYLLYLSRSSRESNGHPIEILPPL